MTEFRPIKDWRKVWEYCDKIADIDKLFDDTRAGTRGAMKRTLKSIVENPDSHVFEMVYDNANVGFFLLFPLGEGSYETHLVLKKGFRGRKGVAIAKEGTDFALSLSFVKMLFAFIPMNTPEVLWFSLAAGWKSIGKIKEMQWLKNSINYPVMGVFAERMPCL